MRWEFIHKVGPWLLPVVVTLPLVLSLLHVERLKRDTIEGKFNRVHLGMHRQLAEEILGPTRYTVQDSVKAWDFEDCMIVIRFDSHGKVYDKSLQRLYQSSH